MSRWMQHAQHAICAPCWTKQHPELGVPTWAAGGFLTRLTERLRVDETCCFCGEVTSAGIYVRHDPYELRCQGNHPDDDEE